MQSNGNNNFAKTAADRPFYIETLNLVLQTATSPAYPTCIHFILFSLQSKRCLGDVWYSKLKQYTRLALINQANTQRRDSAQWPALQMWSFCRPLQTHRGRQGWVGMMQSRYLTSCHEVQRHRQYAQHPIWLNLIRVPVFSPLQSRAPSVLRTRRSRKSDRQRRILPQAPATKQHWANHSGRRRKPRMDQEQLRLGNPSQRLLAQKLTQWNRPKGVLERMLRAMMQETWLWLGKLRRQAAIRQQRNPAKVGRRRLLQKYLLRRMCPRNLLPRNPMP